MPQHPKNYGRAALSSYNLKPLLYLVVLLSACISVFKLNLLKNDIIGDTTRALQQETRRPKLTDGCYHVFLDAGANIGIHSRFLMEPEKYPLAANAHKAFDLAFGSPQTRDPRDICAVGFEPNPAHRQRHAELQKVYEQMGWRYIPIHAGLGDVEGDTIAFYHNDADPSDVPNTEWGFSTVDRRNQGRKEEVPSIHFAKWIEREVLDRTMPETVYGTYHGPTHSNSNPHTHQPEGKVVLKLDIEGTEFLVAPSLLFSGVMCKAIDVAFGEYHAPGHIPVRAAMDPATGKGALPPLADWKAAQLYFNTLWNAMMSMNPKDCRSQWLDMFDDEQYVNDGVPLPTPQ